MKRETQKQRIERKIKEFQLAQQRTRAARLGNLFQGLSFIIALSTLIIVILGR